MYKNFPSCNQESRESSSAKARLIKAASKVWKSIKAASHDDNVALQGHSAPAQQPARQPNDRRRLQPASHTKP